MLMTKVNREEFGIAFTDQGKLTDLKGDGNLYDIDTEDMMVWYDRDQGKAKPYYTYAHFELCGTVYLVLFETADELLAFGKMVELY